MAAKLSGKEHCEKIKAFGTKVRLPKVLCVLLKLNYQLKNGYCDYYHLLLQLICAFFKILFILLYLYTPNFAFLS